MEIKRIIIIVRLWSSPYSAPAPRRLMQGPEFKARIDVIIKIEKPLKNY